MSGEVLFTGFEPFDGLPENPSWDVARAAAAAQPGARAEQVPVTYEAAESHAAATHGGETPPRLVVHLGLSANRPWISIERVARRERSDKPDNDGVAGSATALPDGPDVLPAPVDVETIASRLAAAVRYEVRVSETAGTYVCNALYYQSLRRSRAASVLFVHVPMLSPDEASTVGAALARVLAEVVLRDE